MAEQAIKAIPDLPEAVPFFFAGDSQCTAHSLNPAQLQNDRKRRNLIKVNVAFYDPVIPATY